MDNRTLGEKINDLLSLRISEIQTCLVGKAVAYNKSDETVDVFPVVRDSSGNDKAIIRNAKILFPGVYWDLSDDITSGDCIGLVLLTLDDFHTWWRSGRVPSDPENLSTHDINHAIFIPGLRHQGNGRTLSSGATVLEGDDIRISSNTAAEYVLRGTSYINHEDTFLGLLATWVGQVETAINILAPGAISPLLSPSVTAFKGQIANDLSTKVKVD